MIGVLCVGGTLLLLLAFSGGLVGRGIRAVVRWAKARAERLEDWADGEDPDPLPHRHAAVDLSDEDRRSGPRFGDYLDTDDDEGEGFDDRPRTVSREALARYEGLNLEERARQRQQAEAEAQRAAQKRARPAKMTRKAPPPKRRPNRED